MFVWLTHRQRFEDIIAGCEHAWEFFCGVFNVLIPDNIKAIVRKPDPIDPKFTEGFIEYSQSRGFAIDPARIRRAQDKPRVERTVPFVRNSFFKGEEFRDLEDAQQRARVWCLTTAGLRNHGTMHRKPLQVFEQEEKSALLNIPDGAYDIPLYFDVKVHRDQHFVVGKALYSMPAAYVDEPIHVRVDSHLVKVYHKRQLVKTHPRQPVGGRSSSPSDFPEEKVIYATRDINALQQKADESGPSVGEFARRLLEHREMWRKMRAVFRLLGLVHRYGAGRVELACKRLLEVDVVEVKRVERMVRSALEQEPDHRPPEPSEGVAQPRFARPMSHFALGARPQSGDEHEL
jgi:hypothetical protein